MEHMQLPKELLNKYLANKFSFGRIGTPKDIADAVALIVSDEASWIRGQNLCVNEVLLHEKSIKGQ